MSGSYFRLKNRSGDWNPADEATAGRWLVTYCSLAITLVSVFMMLVSYSSFAGAKVKKYRQSLGSGSGAYIPASAARLGDPVEPAMNELKKIADENGYSGKMDMIRIKNGFKAIMSSGVFFSPGSAKLKEESRAFLNDVTKMAKKSSFSVGVSGHTGELAAQTGENKSDWDLSVSRATGIMRYFLESGKMPAGRLAAAGFSRFRPIASTKTAEGAEKNDRVEFLFIKDVLPE